MARREKTFKKPSYRVNKRILEKYIRSKCDLLGFTARFRKLCFRNFLFLKCLKWSIELSETIITVPEDHSMAN